MDYTVPTATDLADVSALNSAILKLMRGQQGGRLRQLLPLSCQPLVAGLTELQAERLAAAPFLLLSLREQDDAYWQDLLDNDPRCDLFAVNEPAVEEHRRIVAAAIGFAWQLTRRNPYAARLVCGASQNWCHRLASRPIIDVLGRVIERADVLVPRAPNNEEFWRRLLGAGLSSDRDIRSAAHLSALQMILTGMDSRERQRLASAACRKAVPILTM